MIIIKKKKTFKIKYYNGMLASEFDVMALKDLKQHISNIWLVESFKRNEVYNNVWYSYG